MAVGNHPLTQPFIAAIYTYLLRYFHFTFSEQINVHYDKFNTHPTSFLGEILSFIIKDKYKVIKYYFN